MLRYLAVDNHAAVRERKVQGWSPGCTCVCRPRPSACPQPYPEKMWITSTWVSSGVDKGRCPCDVRPVDLSTSGQTNATVIRCSVVKL